MVGKEIYNPAFSEPTPNRGVYFEIKKGIYLVPGSSRAAICDTTTGNVYSINKSAQEVALGLNNDVIFWQELQGLDLVSETVSPCKIEPQKGTPKLDFVWFEIVSDDCNERCLHCYADSMPQTYRRRLLGESQSAPELILANLKVCH